MENYFSFNRKVLATLGLNFGSGKIRFETPLKFFTLTIVLLSSLQSTTFVIVNTGFSLQTVSAFTIGLFDLQGLAKLLAGLRSRKRLKEVSESLNEMIKAITAEQLARRSKNLDFFRKLMKSIFMTNVFCVWTVNAMPMIMLIYFFFTKGIFVKSWPFAFWYPFNKTENYFPTYIYEITCGHILTAIPLIMDGLILLMVGQLLVLFDCVGDNFSRAIDEFKDSMKCQTLEKIKETIDMHSKVLDLSNELISIYEVPLLVNVLMATGTSCFIAFVVSVT